MKHTQNLKTKLLLMQCYILYHPSTESTRNITCPWDRLLSESSKLVSPSLDKLRAFLRKKIGGFYFCFNIGRRFQTPFSLSFGNASTVVTHQTSGSVQEVTNFTLEYHHLKFSFPISSVVLEIQPPAKGEVLLLCK